MADSSWEAMLESPEATFDAAAAIAQGLEGGETIVIDGELGAGKTVFVRGLAGGLGIDPGLVSSPSFVIMQRYSGGRLDLIHADAYRLRSAEELESIGWCAPEDDRSPIRALEWGSRVEALIPADAIRVELRHADAWAPACGLAATLRWIRLTDPDEARFTRLLAGIERSLMPRRCRVCGAPLPRDAPQGAFCSPRCRDADLARWFGERYRLSRPLREDDLRDPR